MSVRIVPEPSDSEREAILAALAHTAEEQAEEQQGEGWAEAALAEGVEESDPEP